MNAPWFQVPISSLKRCQLHTTNERGEEGKQDKNYAAYLLCHFLLLGFFWIIIHFLRKKHNGGFLSLQHYSNRIGRITSIKSFKASFQFSLKKSIYSCRRAWSSSLTGKDSILSRWFFFSDELSVLKTKYLHGAGVQRSSWLLFGALSAGASTRPALLCKAGPLSVLSPPDTVGLQNHMLPGSSVTLSTEWWQGKWVYLPDFLVSQGRMTRKMGLFTWLSRLSGEQRWVEDVG